jgi:elongation factor 1-gamma
MHCYSGSKNAAKALIAAEYTGVKITCPPFEMGVTNKTPAFLKLNPLGKARRRRNGTGMSAAR